MKTLSILSMSMLFASTCFGQAISVNFAGDNGGGTSIFTTAADVAGVVPVANWNGDETQAASGSMSDLVDSSGATTAASVEWSGANNTWGGSGAATADERMVNGWLDDNGNGSTITVTGIPYDIYDVYVYGSSDIGNAGSGWNTEVNGTRYTSGGSYVDPVNASGSYFVGYVDGATTDDNPSYVKVSDLSGGDLTIFGARYQDPAGADFRGAVSGFQIVAVPEPSAFSLIALAGLVVLARRRR